MMKIILAFLLIPSLAFGGAARNFDGSNDYVTANDAARALPLTVVGWFYPDDNDRGAVWAFNSNGHNRNLMFWSQDNSSRRFHHWDDTNSYVDSTSQFNNNEWHHVAQVIDGSGNGTMYVNGTQEATWSNSDTRSADQFSIGQEWDGGSTSDYFDGKAKDVRVYDRALSASEVLASMRCIDQPILGLVGHYTLMESGTNPTFLDISGNGNNGTNVGTTESVESPPTSWCGGNQ